MYKFTSVCVFVLLCAYAHGIQVNTTEGVVEGYKAADGDYLAFYGIPYGGPTEGKNRFKAPSPPAAYPGLLHAIDSNVICAQPTARGLIGKENCLTVSIFTKNVTSSRPVIVWLNSEEYTTSNTQMVSFKRFVEEDVVFVSMNFRLSIFGFLCLGVEEAPGNAGLRDVILGLKWINTNIAHFGGNPNNVVLMGHGSGAAMVDLLTMAPQTNGLIHKAIALSGSGLAPWAVAYDPVGYAELLGAKLAYTGKSRSELANLLSGTDIAVLQTALEEFNFKNNTPLFAPCIENTKLNPNDTVLSDAPINLLSAGKILQIPYIAGYTTLEGTLRAKEAALGNWLSEMQTNFSNFLQVDLRLGQNRTSVAANIRDFYFSNSTINMATIQDYLDYHGDTLVVVPVIRGARERSLVSADQVRLLEFAYLGTLNTDWLYHQIPLNGVRHGAFQNYLFDYDLKPADEAVMRSLVKRLATFASTGTPNVTGTSSPTPWNAISKDQLNYLYYGGSDAAIINQTSIFTEEIRFSPHNQTMNFWDEIIHKYYEPPKPMNSSNKAFCSIILVLICQLWMRLV
ncbi:venom carboxylesterase-6-like [Anticarsia gemmatalis]|uniref:venom carboxylesterase-6-like n=1 Tax=Anticarsia gemmatalis TaxID=129554 RepID=UPI003F771B24